MKTEFISKMT